MNFKKTNNIIGWIVGIIACTTYVLTTEATGSFWDCGEFISSCYKLQIPHPPGAPLFVMLGRVFIILFGDNPLTAAKAVNVMSALASGFTILFLFWTITHFARKIAKVDVNGNMTTGQMWSIMGAGAVGALAYTFSDSFWFSAVEGEVYGMSSFFSAIVFWAILKWENIADEPGADRWLVFIFFLIGLSIGVHLLCLLNIPAVVMVYYFKKRNQFNYARIRQWFIRLTLIGGVLAFIGAIIVARGEINEERGLSDMDGTLAGVVFLGTAIGIGLLYLIENINKEKKEYYGGIYIFFLIGCIITGVTQVAVIQYSIAGASVFDRVFVNSFSLPFFSGFTFFFILIAFLIWIGLRFTQKKGWAYLHLGIWAFAFMLIGYSSYLTTMIRSNADPAIDMYNVDNPMSLVGYLGRDQYGDFPLLYGQKFTADYVYYKKGGAKYQKGKNKYIQIGNDMHAVYAPDDKMLFPRVWDASNDQQHADYYASFLGIEKLRDKDGREKYDHAPNQIDNFKFFFSYQSYWMYFRYFMWNFSGKQSDVQGVYTGNVRDGNWITGISFIDNMMYGDQSMLPDSVKNNKAHNKLFLLPFLLGFIGFFYHLKRRGDDTLSNFLLFFFTGFAIILYLNQAGNQPRERDYAYVGSFYAFAVWIGIGVMQVVEWLQKKMSQTTAATLATVVCLLAVPVLMAQQEWNDHDRSKKVLARDSARNYLESCDKNAILFSFGDNDTYPLWYAQEVEGIRRDVRVINYSLLGIDWYINQLRYKINESAPIDVIWSADQIEGRKRDYVLYMPKPNIPDDRYYNLYDMMKNYVGSDDADKTYKPNPNEDDVYNTFPVRKVSVPVDINFVRKNGTVNAKDSVVSELRFEIQRGNGLQKNDLAVLNIIAANNWKRPIYFTGDFGDLGFGKYLRRDGLSYRLVPVEDDPINADWMMDKLMNKFSFGNANIEGVYFDEENRRQLQGIRQSYAELASYLADKGRKEDAKKVLEKADKELLQSNYPYGMVSRGDFHNRVSLLFLDACYRAGDSALVKKVSAAIKKDLTQQIKYYESLPTGKQADMAIDRNYTENCIKGLTQMEAAYATKTTVPTIDTPKSKKDSVVKTKK